MKVSTIVQDDLLLPTLTLWFVGGAAAAYELAASKWFDEPDKDM